VNEVDNVTEAANELAIDPQLSIETIIAYLDGREPGVALASTRNAVTGLSQLSFADRESAEQQLIGAANHYILDGRHLAAQTTLVAQNLQRRQIEVILALDQEFGWTDNDRRASSLLPFGSEEFSDHLQLLKNPKLEFSTPQSASTVTGWRRILGYLVLGIIGLQVLSAVLKHFSR
jgi:hypothetical protein